MTPAHTSRRLGIGQASSYQRGYQTHSPGHATELLRCGFPFAELELSWIHRDIVAIAISRSDDERLEAAERLSRLPFVYRCTRSDVWIDYPTAAIEAILEATRESDTLPRIRPGEDVEIVDGVPVIPLWIPLAGGSPKCVRMPAALLGTHHAIPWNWSWPYFLRGYLPWAFRRAVDSQIEAVSSPRDTPLSLNRDVLDDGELVDELEERLVDASSDPASVALTSLLDELPAIPLAAAALERVQGFIPGQPPTRSTARTSAAWEYDTPYRHWKGRRFPRTQVTARHDYSERIRSVYQDNPDCDRIVAANPRPTSDELREIREEIRALAE